MNPCATSKTRFVCALILAWCGFLGFLVANHETPRTLATSARCSTRHIPRTVPKALPAGCVTPSPRAQAF